MDCSTPGFSVHGISQARILELGDGERGGKAVCGEEGAYEDLWLIHVDVWQKPSKFYRTIIPQLKLKLKIIQQWVAISYSRGSS